jgi:hypothetical protein
MKTYISTLAAQVINNKNKPISPNEVGLQIPDEVIVAFNELIKRRWDGNESEFTQNDVIELILDISEETKGNLTRSSIFDRGYLNIESIYGKEGWDVTYEKPGIGDDFVAMFIFKKDGAINQIKS